MHAVVLVEWTESERGWGQRPDGVSLHLSAEAAKAYIDDYWKREKEYNPSGVVPDEYSFPESGRTMVTVDDETHKQILESNSGLRLWQGKYRELINEGKLKRAEDL